MQNTHTLIIGAGISGLSVARMLTQKGIDNIVLERASKPGGLVKCDVVDGHLFHRVGGHVFNTKVQGVADWFWDQFVRDEEFLSARRKSGIFLRDQLLGYPIENYLYLLDEATIRKIFGELLNLEQQGKREPMSYPNFEAFLLGNFGPTLYELYFKPYNHKIWKTDLSRVDLPWLEGKLPMPNSREIIMSNILRKEEANMVHSSFFYPRKGGSQFIVDRLAEGLQLNTGVQVETLERFSDSWVVNGQWMAQQVVFTGDLRKLHAMLQGLEAGLLSGVEALKDLRSNGTSNLLCETDPTEHSWIYLPDGDLPAHRIIYTGNFSPTNHPVGSRPSCTVEFSGKTSLESMKATLKRLPGNMKVIDHNFEPNSYVIQYRGDRQRIAAVRDGLREENLHLAGRFAEWEYYNMDKAMERAMEVVTDIQQKA